MIDMATGLRKDQPPTFGALFGMVLEWLKVPVDVSRGRPREDSALFAKRMLEWGAYQVAEKRLESQLAPLELWSVALLVGIEETPLLKPLQDEVAEKARWEQWEVDSRTRWEKVYQRYLPQPKADKTPTE
jgi:hypothetical protein